MVLLPELFVPQSTVIGFNSRSFKSLKDLTFFKPIFFNIYFPVLKINKFQQSSTRVYEIPVNLSLGNYFTSKLSL